MGRRRKYRPLPLEEAERIASSPATPLHLRLYFLAFVENRGDGHCHFRQGQLAKALAIDPRNVTREIRKAIAEDLIRPESTSRCIVLPFGHEYMRDERLPWCSWHESRKAKLRHQETKKTPELRHLVTGSVSELRPEVTKSESVSAGQGVAPSSSISVPTDELSPAVSDSTPSRPHLQVIAS